MDNTVNLFQIADVSRLLVIANCPEDALPALEALDRNERRWTVRTVGAASAAGLPGTIDEIGYLIDPNQHTAVIKGYVENPGQADPGGAIRHRHGEHPAAGRRGRDPRRMPWWTTASRAWCSCSPMRPSTSSRCGASR